MARVPVLLDNSVQLRPLTQERYAAPDMTIGGRAFGAGLQRAGQALGEAALVEDEIDTIYDAARAKDLDNQYQQFENELLYGEEGFYSTQNGDTLNARAATEEAMRAKRAELLALAQTEREKQMLSTVLDGRVNQSMEGVGRFSQGQARSYAQLQSTARIGNATDNYARFADDPVRAPLEMGVIRSEIRQQANLLGLEDVDVIDAMERDAVTRAHKAVVDGKMTDDPVAAMAYLDKHRDEIDAATYDALDRELQPKLMDRDARLIASEVGSIAPEGGQPVELKPVATTRWNVISSPGAARDGGRRVHKGFDIAPAAGNPGWFPTVGFRVEKPRVGKPMTEGGVTYPTGTQGNTADIIITEGPYKGYRVTVMHLASLPKEGTYGAGQLAAIAGNTGNAAKTPTHFHTEVFDARGNRVNDRGVINALFAGGTGGPSAGAGAGATSLDLGEQLAAVDREVDARLAGAPEEYREGVREAARARVRRDHGERKAVEGERFEAEADDAWRVVDGLGDNFTSTSQIANWGKLDPSAQHNFRVLAASNVERKRQEAQAPRQTDAIKFAELSDAYARDPKSLLALRPEQVRPYLDDSDFNTYLGWRREAIKPGDGRSNEWASVSETMSISKDLLAAAGVMPNTPAGRQLTVQFQRRMMDWQTRWARGHDGVPPTSQQILEQADKLMILGTWMEGDEEKRGFAFEAPNSTLVAEIPPNIEKRLRAAYPNASDRELRQKYIAGKGPLW